MTRTRVSGNRLELEIPDGWQLSDETETIEVLPRAGNGAVHFSVVGPTGDQWERDSVARQVAAVFIAAQSPIDDVELVVANAGDATIAGCSFTIESAPGQHIVLRVAVWEELAVVGTFVSPDSTSELRLQADEILSSIAPVEGR